jgi:hypothetical protein
MFLRGLYYLLGLVSFSTEVLLPGRLTSRCHLLQEAFPGNPLPTQHTSLATVPVEAAFLVMHIGSVWHLLRAGLKVTEG